LVLTPGRAEPKLVESGPSGIKLRYELPNPSELRVGLGNIQTTYWEGTLLEPSHAVVTIDPERGVPVSEDVYTKDGSLGASLAYDEYERLPDGSWVPLRIAISSPNLHVAARSGHMEYVLRFQVLDRDTWLLADGTATEVTPGGHLLQAYASLVDAVVHR
jgi:hypothetical protein